MFEDEDDLETDAAAKKALDAAQVIDMETDTITRAVDLYKQQNLMVLSSVTMKQFAEELIAKVAASIGGIKRQAQIVIAAATPPPKIDLVPQQDNPELGKQGKADPNKPAEPATAAIPDAEPSDAAATPPS